VLQHFAFTREKDSAKYASMHIRCYNAGAGPALSHSCLRNSRKCVETRANKSEDYTLGLSHVR
jgi:hypothetical protein